MVASWHNLKVRLRRVNGDRSWVMLVYHLPREPSTPRIGLWRRLRQLGAIRPADSVAMLPRTARSEEQFEWLAAGIVEAGGEATVWIGHPTATEASVMLMAQMADERQAEYEALVLEANQASHATGAERERARARLRRQLEQVRQRDYASPPARERAVEAIEALGLADIPHRSSADGDTGAMSAKSEQA